MGRHVKLVFFDVKKKKEMKSKEMVFPAAVNVPL